MANILVVDDEAHVRGAILFALKDTEHDVAEAENGIEAEEQLAENNFDLVITDIIMPEKEGLELIFDIQKNYPDLKVIAVTGDIFGIRKNKNLRCASLMGADDTLLKPFGPDTLLKCIEDCLLGKN